MTVTSKDDLIADVQALVAALQAMAPSEAREKAIYHTDRLAAALRTSHSEGTRFAAFTVSRIVGGLGPEASPTLVETMARIRAALEARGIDLSK
jgi:hypothetical protein